MNTTFALSITLVHLALAAQGPPRPLTSGEQRFQRFDKNADGKLAQDEFPHPYFFKQYDKDGDGVLSQTEAAEIKRLGRQAPSSPGPTGEPVPRPAPASAGNLKPRPHGDEATKAGLKPDVLAKLDIAMQQAVAEERFKKFDNKGYGRLTREEFPATGIFDGASPWIRIAEIRLPADAPHPQLKSCEPVNGGRGAFGRSWFTAQGGDDKDKDTSIWLIGFDPKGHHTVRRLDEGAATKTSARRLDPESLVCDRELFVYYTLVGDGPSQLHRCQTGVLWKP
ncbi:MAG: EF-hand domain-containing protein [Verrucomicrobiae bacterium]|nr:EF-hand domain-containing protein [Verrucomicrobiae bacterium]